MYRRVMFVFIIITTLSMLISGSVLAQKGRLTTWKTVFDPGVYMMPDAVYFIHSV